MQKFDNFKLFNIILKQNLTLKLIKMDFSKAQELMKLQQEAMKVKKELENTYIESVVSGLVITVNWEMKIEKAEFETNVLIPGLNDEQKKALEKAIVDAVNKWVKKSQEVAAEKMQWVMSKMGMWDMLGWLPGLK